MPSMPPTSFEVRKSDPTKVAELYIRISDIEFYGDKPFNTDELMKKLTEEVTNHVIGKLHVGNGVWVQRCTVSVGVHEDKIMRELQVLKSVMGMLIDVGKESRDRILGYALSFFGNK